MAGIGGLRISDGLFNPFLGEQIRDVGYDRDFSELDVQTTAAADDEVTVPGCATADDELASPCSSSATGSLLGLRRASSSIAAGSVRTCADMVVSELLSAAGGDGRLGGDVSVGGSWPDEGWRIRDRRSDGPAISP